MPKGNDCCLPAVNGNEMNDFRIRQFQSGDWNAIVRLHKLALEEVGGYFPGPWDDDLENIEAVYLNGYGDFIVGLSNGEIVAMGALRKVSNETGEIKRMRVHPDFQRKGHGTAILDKLENTAKALGYRRLCLDTTSNRWGHNAFIRSTDISKWG